MVGEWARLETVFKRGDGVVAVAQCRQVRFVFGIGVGRTVDT